MAHLGRSASDASMLSSDGSDTCSDSIASSLRSSGCSSGASDGDGNGEMVKVLAKEAQIRSALRGGTASDVFEVTPVSGVVLPNRAQVFVVTFTPTVAQAIVTGSFTVRQAGLGDLTVALRGVGATAAIKASESQVEFGAAKIGRPVNRIIELRNEGLSPATFTAECDTPVFSVDPPHGTIHGRGKITVTLSFGPYEKLAFSKR